MALDGAKANLGPESKEWERKLEERIADYERRITALERLAQGATR
ncbi:hypothetical protein [Microbacterium sp. T32]|nr:hypothetical protein [Microbacterium sp. T32]